jgi:DNA repair exonuclease SbcCD nuclease subunit
MPIRLLHTADIHLDASFSAGGFAASFGPRRRQQLRDVLADAVKRAADWPADALLIAGDLFDSDRVTQDTVDFVRRLFESTAPLPVVITPGNHDPYTPGSRYATTAWPANVHIFSEPGWKSIEIGDTLTVHGFAFDGPDISFNPFGTLTLPDDGRIHVAVGHGAERGSLPDGQKLYAPFDAADTVPHGLRYLALGHYHGFKRIEVPTNTEVWYSGAPEGHGFDEPGMRYWLEVTVDEERTNVTPVESARAVYTRAQIDCGDFKTSQDVVEAIRGVKPHADRGCIAKVILRGTAAAAWRGNLPDIRESVASEFEYLQIDDQTIAEEAYSELAEDPTSMGLFVRRMNEAIATEFEPRQRRLYERARELGVAAYRGEQPPLPGI